MPHATQQGRFGGQQSDQCHGNKQASPRLHWARGGGGRGGEVVLNGGDDEIGFEASDAASGGLPEQELPAGPRQGAADQTAGNQIREIARRRRAVAQDGRSRPVPAGMPLRLLGRQADKRPLGLERIAAPDGANSPCPAAVIVLGLQRRWRGGAAHPFGV